LKKIKINLIPLFLLFFSACALNVDSDTTSEISDSTTTTIAESNSSTTLAQVEFELPYKHYFKEINNCEDFLGSQHKIECVNEVKIELVYEFNSPVVNIIKSREAVYSVQQSGIINKLDLNSKTFSTILDKTGQVTLDSLESGLLSFCIHPTNDEFLTSYINSKNELIFELFYFDQNIENITNSKILLSVPSFSNSHYSGGIAWSDYFDSYLVSIGDMVEANFESRLNHMPLDDSRYYGKIVALSGSDKTIISNSKPLIPENNIPLDNVVASGLRNPWQFFEFKDYLIIADTGFTQNEELNIFKYGSAKSNFGWPIFEATKRSEDLDNIENYSLDKNLFIELDENIISGKEFVENYSVRPAFYYNHHPCLSEQNENCDGKAEIYRAAIIGGDILINPSSKYNFDIFVGDYLSQELFSINLITRDLKIINIPGVSNITSVKTNFGVTDEILVSTYEGKIYKVSLP